MNPMTLLVFAAVVLVLAGAVMQMYVLPREELQKTISNQLATARLQDGMAVEAQIRVLEGTLVNRRSFDEQNLTMALECNHPGFCCDKNDACGRIEWTDSQLRFPTRQLLWVSTRCEKMDQLSVCRSFIGSKPPQVIILKQTGASDHADIQIENTGEGPAWMKYARVEYLERVEKNGQATFEPRFEKNEPSPFRGIEAQTEKTWTVPLHYDQSGFYRVSITLETQNAGSASTEFDFRIARKPTDCRADTQTEPSLFQDPETSQVYERLPCFDCTFAYECRDRWISGGRSDASIGSPAYAIAPSISP